MNVFSQNNISVVAVLHPGPTKGNSFCLILSCPARERKKTSRSALSFPVWCSPVQSSRDPIPPRPAPQGHNPVSFTGGNNFRRTTGHKRSRSSKNYVAVTTFILGEDLSSSTYQEASEDTEHKLSNIEEKRILSP